MRHAYRIAKRKVRDASLYCGIAPASAIPSPMDDEQSIDVERMRQAIRDAVAGGKSYRQISLAAGMEGGWARQFIGERSNNPKMETVAGLARALGVPAAQFFVNAPVPANAPAAPALPMLISLPVQLPSAEALTEMFAAMLAGLPDHLPADERAQALAALLPVSLSRAAAGVPSHGGRPVAKTALRPSRAGQST